MLCCSHAIAGEWDRWNDYNWSSADDGKEVIADSCTSPKLNVVFHDKFSLVMLLMVHKYGRGPYHFPPNAFSERMIVNFVVDVPFAGCLGIWFGFQL